jgi:hypothetical protein
VLGSERLGAARCRVDGRDDAHGTARVRQRAVGAHVEVGDEAAADDRDADQESARTGLINVPSPSMVASTVSPSCR